MRIKILCVGKLKEKYLKDAVSEYTKRLSAYSKISIVEVADGKDENPASIKKEGQRLVKNIKDNEYVIALSITGKAYSSTAFSKLIDGLGIRGKSDIVFIIGGSNGLDDEVIKKVDLEVSFSKMTFPHQLMRVILVEQIYRAFKISRGEKYHK